MTYKTAEQLGLSEKNWKALIAFCDAVALGEIRSVKLNDPLSAGDYFNMQFFLHKQPKYIGCGTLMCAGGWMRDKFGAEKNVSECEQLEPLFYPSREYVQNWDEVTAEDVEKLCRLFLQTGEWDWSITAKEPANV